MEVGKKKPCNDQQKNKVVVKVGGGGGIGAVILLGGALATAALASAFVVREKGRSSGEERRRNRRDSATEFSKQSGGDDASSDVHNKHSGDEATKEVQLENGTGLLVSTRSQILDEKPGIVVNCGMLVNGCDAETTEQISSMSPHAVSDHGPPMINEYSQPSDEKSTFELENVAREEETEQDVANESLKESDNTEQACVTEGKVELEHIGDGVIEPVNHNVEITETKQVEEEENDEKCRDQDDSEVIAGHNGGEGVDIDNIEAEKNVTEEKGLEVGVDNDRVKAQKTANVSGNLEENGAEGCITDDGERVEEESEEGIEKTEGNVEVQQEPDPGNGESVAADSSLSETVASESLAEDERRGDGCVFENPVVKQEHVNGDEKEGAVPTEVVEMIQEDAALEGSEKDQMNELEGRGSDNGDINEEKCDEEGVEKTEDDKATDVSESHVDDELIALQLEFQDPVIERVVVDGDEKEGAVASEVAEMSQQDEAIQGGEEEDRMKHSNEEQMVNENNKDNEEIAIEVKKDDGADKEMARSMEASESKASMPPVVCQLQDDEAEVEKNAAHEVEEELIHHEDVEVKKQDGENEDSAKLEMKENKSFVCQPKGDANDNETNPEVKQEDGESKEVAAVQARGDVAKEVEQGLITPGNIEAKEESRDNVEIAESLEASEEKTPIDFVVSQVEDVRSEPIDTGAAAAKDDEIVETSEDSIKDYSDETDSSEEIEQSSAWTGESSVGSNGEAVWPAESLEESTTTNVLDQEVHGKTLEDKAAALKEKDNRTGFAKGTGNLEKPIFIRKDYAGTATTRRTVIAILSVVSSLSCSWLFGLSPVKMCLIVSLAMVLSKIQGY